jgi:hypothetical protein
MDLGMKSLTFMQVPLSQFEIHARQRRRRRHGLGGRFVLNDVAYRCRKGGRGPKAEDTYAMLSMGWITNSNRPGVHTWRGVPQLSAA